MTFTNVYTETKIPYTVFTAKGYRHNRTQRQRRARREKKTLLQVQFSLSFYLFTSFKIKTGEGNVVQTMPWRLLMESRYKSTKYPDKEVGKREEKGKQTEEIFQIFSSGHHNHASNLWRLSSKYVFFGGKIPFFIVVQTRTGNSTCQYVYNLEIFFIKWNKNEKKKKQTKFRLNTSHNSIEI